MVRIDFGIRITIEDVRIYPRGGVGAEPRYCAIGAVKYSDVDGEGIADGKLIYIKPALYEGAPADVYNYGATSSTFPHESTADQFFSERQFESYRALGEYILSRVCAGKEEEATAREMSIEELVKAAKEYVAKRPTVSAHEGGVVGVGGVLGVPGEEEGEGVEGAGGGCRD